jgi:hypothetical protein
MKKIAFILVTGLLVLSSCKKDYMCTCTHTSGSSETFTYHQSKSVAKQSCDTDQTTNDWLYPDGEVTCTLSE